MKSIHPSRHHATRGRIGALAAAVGLALLTVTPGASAAPADAPVGDAGHSAALEAAAQAVHNFPAKADLDGRAGPSLSSQTLKVNAYLAGGNVPVVCQITGGEAYGSTIWDKTSDGYYVADAYVSTGYSGFHPDVPRCSSGGGSTVRGIDVSGYQGADVDFAGQYASGVRFAYIKSTEGSTYTSPNFSQQWSRATAAGMIRGAYHFANPAGASGATQATYFVNHGGGWSADGKTLPGALDIEYGSPTCYGLSTSAMNTWIKDFLTKYQALTGRKAPIYTTTDWWKQCTGNTSQFSGYPLWVANYNGTYSPLPAGWTGTQTFWQYSSSNNLDKNTYYGTLAQLKAFATG